MSTQRMSHLLGEVRREMHGAVVESMCYYGDAYGLNYGVSIPTIRKIAKSEGIDHKLARLLYRQDVRELKIAALWIADCREVDEQREFWIEGIINSEMAEEAAHALLYKCRWVADLLVGDNELHAYSAALAIARRLQVESVDWSTELLPLWSGVAAAVGRYEKLLPRGVVAILDLVIRAGATKAQVDDLLSKLPTQLKGCDYIREEVAWRLDL